ncbi:MAG TPA: hypothetical protein VMF05_03560 [Stellaceae bacterium]|nr:hypothetical protein [Stellaceae bacterium]
MIKLSFAILCVAGLCGMALAVVHLRAARPASAQSALAVLHGVIGAAGLAILLVDLDHMPRQHAMGTTGFGRTSAVLLALALLLGLTIAAVRWRRRRPNGALIGVHAGLAIAGLVVLSALLALG